MNRNFFFISVLSALSTFLIACGGSSSSDTESEQYYTFNLTGQLVNKCGVANSFADFEVFLQNENWQTLKSYKPNTQGEVSFILTKETINYTIVAKTAVTDQEQGYDIVSYHGVNTATPAIYSAKFDSKINNSTCQCIKQNLELRHRPFKTISNLMSSATFDTWQAIDERTTQFTNVEVCRDKTSAWPVHSFAVLGTNSSDDIIGVAEFVDNYPATIDKTWVASGIEVADYQLQLDRDHQEISTSQIINNIKHFAFVIPATQRTVNLFNSHLYSSSALFASESSYQFADVTSLLGTFKLQRHHRIVSEMASSSLDVNASSDIPNIDQQYLSELKPDNTYDFTAVKNYPLINIEFNYDVLINDISRPVTWNYFGPAAGSLPMNYVLAGYEPFASDINTIDKMKIKLFKSSSTDNYQEYIAFAQQGNPQNFTNELDTITLEVE